MFSWLAEKLIVHNVKAIRAGDIKPTTLLYADDGFVGIGLQIYPGQVVLEGFPWRVDQWLKGAEEV